MIQADRTMHESQPIGVTINGADQDLPSPITVAELLVRLDLNRNHVAVEINRQIVPREEHADVRLAPGDQLEIVTLVGGG
jgi:thiamine biosynthesis protein ThiS